jgi:hypothetical protein
MRIRFSCLLVGAAMLALGTMAYAQPLIGGPTCVGTNPPVCTITETLYFSGTGNANGAGNFGTATSTQNYVAPTSGNPNGTNLTSSTWQATYTFDQYGFFATGYALASSSFTVYDATTGSIALSQTTGGPGYYGYNIGAVDEFSLTSSFTGIGHSIISDDSTAAASNEAQTPPPAYSNCAGDAVSPTNGSTDSTGCVYLVSGASSVIEGGYNNTSASTTAPLILTTGSSTANIYEQVTGNAGISGPSPNSDAPNSAAGASEVVVTFTYDGPSSSVGGTPEPATLLLLGTGLSFVASRLRRNKNEAK